VKLKIGSSVNRKNGKYTIWFTVNVLAGAADFAEKYLHTGDLVHVTGSLIPDYDTGNSAMFQRSDGEYVSNYVVRGRVLTLLHKKEGDKRDYLDVDF
jgi:single-stranded DNA-binding protein